MDSPPVMEAGNSSKRKSKGKIETDRDIALAAFKLNNVFLQKYADFAAARSFVRSLGLKTRKGYYRYITVHQISNLPKGVERVYFEFKSWKDFLGTDGSQYLSYEDCHAWVAVNILPKGINSFAKWMTNKQLLPADIPVYPHSFYKAKGWEGWSKFLQTDHIAPTKIEHLSYEECKKWIREHLLTASVNTSRKFHLYQKKLPVFIPRAPALFYENKGWKGWEDFLGVSIGVNNPYFKVKDIWHYDVARKWVQQNLLKEGVNTSLKFTAYMKGTDFKDVQRPPGQIPKSPQAYYQWHSGKKGEWISWADFLGTKRVHYTLRTFWSYQKARSWVLHHVSKDICGFTTWLNYVQNKTDDFAHLPRLPSQIPHSPWVYYQGKGWESMGKWIGKRQTTYWDYEKCSIWATKKFNRTPVVLIKDWRAYVNGVHPKQAVFGKLPKGVPPNPHRYYKEYSTWRQFIRNPKVCKVKPVRRRRKKPVLKRLKSIPVRFLPYKRAQAFTIKELVRKRGVSSYKQYHAAVRELNLPFLPLAPAACYKSKGWAGWDVYLGKKNMPSTTNDLENGGHY